MTSLSMATMASVAPSMRGAPLHDDHGVGLRATGELDVVSDADEYAAVLVFEQRGFLGLGDCGDSPKHEGDHHKQHR